MEGVITDHTIGGSSTAYPDFSGSYWRIGTGQRDKRRIISLVGETLTSSEKLEKYKVRNRF